ncbi:MAG TPA: DNA replication/repair protein RecF [Rhodanobacteraceae bacterium]|nr:DNA replication/repair protein RecF [Rhodanobacteraceae bacterium]
MRLSQLRLENLRAFASLDIELAPGWNVFIGANGAGKTTLLEAAYLLSHARSFRGGPKDVLVRRGADSYSVFGRVERGEASAGLGLWRREGVLEARVSGTTVPVAELLRQIAVACFEPGSHELISGPSEGRRRFLDWGVFHVEHDFLPVWRAFQRALRQRNALLRERPSAADLKPWDRELARTGVALAALRAHYFAAFAVAVAGALATLLPELGQPAIALESGWRGEGDPIELLAAAGEDDLRRGFTTRGPHRADWSVTFEHAPRREHLSRGQEKLCALACILAQARVFADVRGEWPIVCIDDLASELDGPHQEVLVQSLRAVDAQILVTGTQEPEALARTGIDAATFHVEPGRAGRLL